MKSKDCEEFLKKNVKIFLKNGFIYNGEILKILDESILISDRYFKKIVLDADSLMSIGENDKDFEHNKENPQYDE